MVLIFFTIGCKVKTLLQFFESSGEVKSADACTIESQPVDTILQPF